MKILVVKEEAGLNGIRFTLPYNSMSKNILKLLYLIYKNHLIYIVEEYECVDCGFTEYKVVVILTYDEFLNSEV